MKVAVLIAPRDFKDETLSRLKLLFSKKDVDSQVASPTHKSCTGYHGAVVKPETEFAAVHPNTFDAILIADGPGVDSLRLYEHRPLLDIIRAFHENNRMVIGIGNGIKAVAKANIIKDAKIAKTDDETTKIVRLYRGSPTEDPVVQYKKLFTASSADDVAGLVEMLVSAQSA